MDIINRRSATTLLVCFLAGTGFFMDAGSHDAGPPPPPMSRPTLAELPVAAAAISPAEVPAVSAVDVPAQAGDPVGVPPPAFTGEGQPARQVPAALEVGQGVRLQSAPLPEDVDAAAKRALVQDLDALLH